MNYHEDLKAYLDGELSPDRAEEITRALERDPRLAQEAEELRSLSAAFAAVPQPQPRGLDNTLRALRLAEPSPPRKAPWAWWLGVGIAAAGAVVMMLQVFAPPGQLRGRTADAGASSEMAKAAAPPTTFSKQYVARADPEVQLKAAAPQDKPSLNVARGKPPSDEDLHAEAKKSVVNKRFRESVAVVAPPAPPVEQKPAPAAGGKAVTSLQMAKVDQPVELKVASIENAEQALLTLAQQHEGELLKRPDRDGAGKEIVIELPADEAPKLLEKLKQLPKELAALDKAKSESAPAPASRNSALGGLGGGGGFGGRSAGAGGASADAAASVREEVAQKKRVAKKKIRIILLPEK